MTALAAATSERKRRFFAAPLVMLRRQIRPAASPTLDDEPPLRAALLNAEQMERHGRLLARTHELRQSPEPDVLLKRLADNEALLVRTCESLAEATSAKRRIAPSGEWLLDNFYLVTEQIRVARRHLPRGYSTQLPQLSIGASAGRPRVYDIALEAIAHGDGRIDRESLRGFIGAYQSVTALKLGELWAIPIMLRLALIENLRRVGVRTARGLFQRELAESWADRLIAGAEGDPNSLILIIADMVRSGPPVDGPFVAEFVRRLQGRTSALALPLTWLEQRLSETGSTIEQVVQAENQQQASDQVSVGNSIGSLRFLNALDWRLFVESMSVVEQALRCDPAGSYSRQDFGTRDRYRHVVEALAQRTSTSEDVVANKAIELARAEPSAGGADARTRHVGYYLIDAGLQRLQHALGMRTTIGTRIRAMSLTFYLGAIGLMTAAFAVLYALQAARPSLPGILLLTLTVLALFAGSQLAVSFVNLIVTLAIAPQRLPRMDFSKGIPAEWRCLVVVPTMLLTSDNVEELLESLEVRFLANRSEHVHFGLLTDFSDARSECLPEDETLLAQARHGIEALNEKYAAAPNTGFFLFHRPRRWNARDRVWRGRERKRGKLEDLNALLRGRTTDAFALVIGDTGVLGDVRLVITLDTDTQLPRDAAYRLIEAMAHPLNRPGFDASRRRVTRGYGILQPRVTASVPDLAESRYGRMLAGEAGIDPYTRAVSDVYQDLFGEGSYIGKGIYDVDAFEHVLEGRLPDDRILSHDLLEGSYARAGLLSDVQLFEKYPARYTTDAARRHRWTRGDWQIARWTLPKVPHPQGGDQPNPLSMLARWKILDNLRRSLVAPAMVALLWVSWLTLSPAWAWTLAVLSIGTRRAGCRVAHRASPQAGGHDAPTAPRSHRPVHTRACCAGGACARLPAVRGVLQSRCNGALDRAHPREAQAARVDDRKRGREREPHRTGCVLRDDVERARYGHRRRTHARADGAGHVRFRGTAARPVVCRAGHCLVGEPRTEPQADIAHERGCRVPAENGAQDVAVLRRFRRCSRSSPAPGQLPGASGAGYRASHVPNEHGHGAARERIGIRFRISARRAVTRPHGARVRDDAASRAPPGSFLQLVRHPVVEAACAALRFFGR